MAKKIALVLTGAVSLGSFEGGVLVELLHALDQRREWEIDVVAGASAGSINAALLGRALFDRPERRRAFFDAWVEDADILRLLADDDGPSILSRDHLDALARKHLGGDVAPGLPRGPLYLSFTLANVNGVDYKLPVHWSGADGLRRTVFRDRITHEVTSGADTQTWDDVRSSAVASACLPFAFTPAKLKRVQTDYQDTCLDPFPGEFCYLDGGLFDNQPIGDAVDLARKADKATHHGTADEDRLFLLVAPYLNRSWHDKTMDGQRPLLELAERLGIMMWVEAAALDWARAQRTNVEVEWRNRVVKELIDLVKQLPSGVPEAAAKRLDDVAHSVAGDKRTAFPSRYDDDYVTRSIRQTGQRFRGMLRELPSGQQDLATRMIFLLNSVAGLDKKTRLDLHVVAANASQLAGEQAFGFGGFLERTWREHDYLQGRIVARDKLPKIIGEYAADPSFDYVIPPKWKDLPSATIGQAQREPRRQLRKRIARVIGRAVGESEKGTFAFATRPLFGLLARTAASYKLKSLFEL